MPGGPVVAGRRAGRRPREPDFPPRSPDDVFIIYTGGTTGHPKGVMWRHEDIWRTLGGGIDFMTGVPLADEWAQSRRGAEGDGMVRMAPAPLIHGAAMVATLACLFGGDTAVIPPKFDPDAIWSAVQRLSRAPASSRVTAPADSPIRPDSDRSSLNLRLRSYTWGCSTVGSVR